MKLHFHLVRAVENALRDIFENGKQADKVIEKVLKSNPKWGSRDRGFIAETTYECVRWHRLYAHIAFDIVSSTASLLDIIGVHLVLKNKNNILLSEFNHLNYKVLQKKYDAIQDRKIKQSIPDWLDAIGEKELGAEKWLTEITALNRLADVVIRVNTLKATVSDVQKKLADLGWENEKIAQNMSAFRAITPCVTDGVLLKKRGNIFATDIFKQGHFEVQDGGSQLIAPFLDVQEGMRVVDACAGAGGKTLHLATLMHNKGRIIALDTEGWKLEELRKRAKRNGIHIIETRTIDTTKVVKRLHDSADRLLLDVPCSGLGVLRRNPDAKWKLKPEFLDTIRQTQQEIITNYSKIVKKGGKMVYATCSILPSENQNQVQLFLEKNKDWIFIKDRTVYPSVEGFDGFYMALLERSA
jgi:16S rRNA (cytosine967-C5)-methyltransferase